MKGQPFPLTMYHYSRFPFRFHHPGAMEGQQPASWCGTYLFYCSSELQGPLSLFPLEGDKTLAAAPPAVPSAGEGSNNSTFHPQFLPFRWDMNAFDTDLPMGIIDLGDSVIESVTKNLLLHPKFNSEFRQDVEQRYGLQIPDAAEVGIEKAMALVLWMCSVPGIIGFTYSHEFSTVSEPNTVCLAGSSASAMLQPMTVVEPAAQVVAATRCLTMLCKVLEGMVSINDLMGGGDADTPTFALEPDTAVAVQMWLQLKVKDMIRTSSMIDAEEGEGKAGRNDPEVLMQRFSMCCILLEQWTTVAAPLTALGPEEQE